MSTTPLRVGLIGTGRISDLHAIEYLQNPDARIVALCDRDAGQARAKAAAWGIPDVAIDDDIDAFLARPDLDRRRRHRHAAVDPHQIEPRPQRHRLAGARRRERLAAGKGSCRGRAAGL
jgi:hypothetical protein